MYLSNRSTNLDGSHQNLLTPSRDVYNSSHDLLTQIQDGDYYSGSKMEFDSTSKLGNDLLTYWNRGILIFMRVSGMIMRIMKRKPKKMNLLILLLILGRFKRSNLEWLENLQVENRFEEIEKIQKERENAALEYVSHLSNLRSETGENLVEFPENFEDIVKSTVEEARTMEDLKEQGIIQGNEIERFIREKITSDLNPKNTQNEGKKQKEVKCIITICSPCLKGSICQRKRENQRAWQIISWKGERISWKKKCREEENLDELMQRVVPNPYDTSYGEGRRYCF